MIYDSLIGIPYRFGSHSRKRSDCFGLVIMFYFQNYGIVLTPKKWIWPFRDKSKDVQRTIEGLSEQGFHVVPDDERQRVGDILILHWRNETCVCIAVNPYDVLMTSKDNTSHIRNVNSIKNLIAARMRFDEDIVPRG